MPSTKSMHKHKIYTLIMVLLYPAYTQTYTLRSRVYTLYTLISHIRARTCINNCLNKNILSRARVNICFWVYRVYAGDARV